MCSANADAGAVCGMSSLFQLLSSIAMRFKLASRVTCKLATPATWLTALGAGCSRQPCHTTQGSSTHHEPFIAGFEAVVCVILGVLVAHYVFKLPIFLSITMNITTNSCKKTSSYPDLRCTKPKAKCGRLESAPSVLSNQGSMHSKPRSRRLI